MKFLAPNKVRGQNLLTLFIQELGGPRLVAKYLDVNERTVYHWMAKGCAPRSAVLALFWESKYGHSLLSTTLQNEVRLLQGQLRVFASQYQRAKDMVTGLRALHAGAANEPLFDELPDLPRFSRTSFATTEELELFAKLARPDAQENLLASMNR